MTKAVVIFLAILLNHSFVFAKTVKVYDHDGNFYEIETAKLDVDFSQKAGKAKLSAKKIQYVMIILYDQTELRGYMSMTDEGEISIKGQSVYGDLQVDPALIRSIRVLQRVFMKLKDNSLVIGHVIRQTKDTYLVEGLVEPRTVRKVRKEEITSLKGAKKIKITEKRRANNRFYAGAGFMQVITFADNALQNGLAAFAGYDREVRLFFKSESGLMPDLRIEGGLMLAKTSTHTYQGIPAHLGPLWQVEPFQGRFGLFSFAALAGITFEKLASSTFSGNAISASAMAIVSYQYYYKFLALQISGRYYYAADKEQPFTAFLPTVSFVYRF